MLDRKKVYASKFVNVYKDRVRLPNGGVINDYTVIEKPSYVIIVATDYKGRIVAIKEYKHGAGEVQLALPAGLKETDESPIRAAKRELREETGYTNGVFRYIGRINEYASKDMHNVYVVRAEGLKSRGKQNLETSEDIEVKLISVKDLKLQIRKKIWKNSSALAALVFSGLVL
ncbi:TPA: NUDIX hydrolase [Candidatus Micrarchaeota archaeon]|nr:NUDIX hydrolase [Candidatus Micrarchaeota archaeon]HII09729.1 NUDIX hydrolase [Candidatus Micrarchaeota archaeon]